MAGCLAAALVGLAAPGACIDPEPFRCTIDAQCDAEGLPGFCDQASKTCLYMSQGCPSHFADAQGTCVTPGGGSGSSGGGDGDGQGPGGSTGGGSGAGADTSSGSDTGAAVGCAGAEVDLTGEGIVGADSTFDQYEPSRSVDGDLATSWFSTGPESGGAPTNYTWTMGIDRCISRILLAGNAMNEEPNFRQNFGFESVTIRVFDSLDNLAFEEERTLAGTPDPDTTVETGGVLGSRVVLALAEHEDDSCGGFAELQVLGEL